MNTPLLKSFALAGLLAAACVAGAQAPAAGTQLQPQAARITDAAITADQRGYEALQARIKALNDAGRPARDYFLSKAQCWLDVSFHEYTRNDRGPFPQAAMTESEKLVRAMESRAPNVSMETPLVAGAERLRSDLWQRALALRTHSGFQCAAQKAACAEVELVHAGHEQQQIGWRHAKPYVQIAEDLVGEAEALARACTPPAPPPVVAVVAPPPPSPPAPPPPAAPPPPPLQLAANVVFAFDKAALRDITPASLASLQALVDRIKAERLVVTSIALTGHADRLNRTGQADYNQRLSERRVGTVRAWLAERGVDVSRVATAAVGDTRQALACEGSDHRSAKLQECLTPNRRVEVQITATRP